VVSAAAARVVRRGRTVAQAVAGRRRIGGDEPPRPADLFDAASLTKPFVATLAVVLDAEGALPLGTRIGDLLPEARSALARRSLEDLLRHRSGLAPWYPLESLAPRGARPKLESLLHWLATGAPLGASPGTYSDLGFLLWGLLVARSSGWGLARLLRELVLVPLGLESEVSHRPARGRAVDCVLDDGRERELARSLGVALRRPRPSGEPWRGIPQDGNARRVGSLCGHAGLFVSVDALAALGGAWLPPAGLPGSPRLAAALAGPRGGWALGWARRSRAGSSGLALSRSAFGHAGFAGSSLWIDPERDAVLVLAAHRVASRVDFNPTRREFHRLAAEHWL
jgi:CubicO group peptidase (beta-lactamase class C family)